MPDGTQVNFPDDMPQEQIKGLISSKFPDIAKQTSGPRQNPDPSNPGFSSVTQPISDFIEAQKQRGANLANIVNATQQDEQSVPEGVVQGLMNEVGAAAQVPATAGQIASKVAYDMLPQSGQSAVQGAQKAIAPIAQAYQQNQDAFNAENPRAGRNLAAIREGVNLLPLASSGVRGAIEEGAQVGGQALKNVGSDIAKGTIEKVAAATKPEPMLTSDYIKDLARASYQTAEERGGTLTPDFANKFFDTVDGMRPQTEHGVATAGDSALAKLTDDWKVLKDKPISLQAAQEMDEGLSKRIDTHVDKVTGKLDKQGQELYDVQSKFRNAIDNATPNDIIGGKKIGAMESFDALKEARAQWSAALRVGDMERILTRASMTDNPATSIKAGFRTLYNNPARMRGYNGAERAAIKKAAQSGVISGTLRTVLGSRLIGTALGTTLGTAGGGLIGGMAGAGAGAAQAAAARAIAARMQTGRANKAIKTISKRIK